MMQRVFYVTQGSLRVWLADALPDCTNVEFADDDQGLQEFDRFLAVNPEQSSAMLLDVIEEEFSLDTIPKLGSRDRAALVERRGRRKFGRTSYRVSVVQGRLASNDKELSVVHSAISNHELVDPWLKIILDHHTPLSGIYSVPLMTPSIVRKLFTNSPSVMFVAPHQGRKLRQAFLQDGALRSARLSPGPGVADDAYAQFVVTETMRSRRYLERARLLASTEMLQVCIVADAGTAEEILSLVVGDNVNKFQFIDPSSAAGRLGCAELRAVDHFEEVFLVAVAKRRPKYSYARSGENCYWRMRRMRDAIIAAAMTTAAVCTVLATVLLSDVWILRNRIFEIQSQVDFLSETFRRENEKFSPISADSHEMQLAVDTGDYLLANRVPVPWVMNQLGIVLGDYSDIQLRKLHWSAESAVTDDSRQGRPGEASAPVVVPLTHAVSAVLTADIVPFDGDMRQAFSRIDQLAADIAAGTNFHRAEVLRYPFNASTNATVSGEIVGEKSNAARFQLRVSYDLTDRGQQAGGDDEST